MLVEYFVQRYATRAGKNIRSIDKNTLRLLQAYDWPGNIRELQNVIERSVILSSTAVFTVDESWLPIQADRGRPAAVTFASSLGDVRPGITTFTQTHQIHHIHQILEIHQVAVGSKRRFGPLSVTSPWPSVCR